MMTMLCTYMSCTFVTAPLKKDLRKYADKSAVARAVLAQWNRLNTVIRRQVYGVKVQVQ